MLTIRHILFPTEFSSRDRLAEEYVRRLAEHFGACVTVLHVVDRSAPYHYDGQQCEETSDTKRLHEHIDARLADVLPSIATDRVVMFGDIATGIADCAEESNTDLIMIPFHPRSRLRRVLGDSVAASVLNDKRWHVWSTSRDSEEPGHEHYVFKKMLCIISPESPDAMQCTVRLAHAFQATLSAGYVETDSHGPVDRVLGLLTGRDWDSEPNITLIDRTMKAIRHEAGTRLDLLVESGAPSAAIARIARRADADLVVIARSEASRLSPPLHSTLCAIVRDAPCPVMVV